MACVSTMWRKATITAIWNQKKNIWETATMTMSRTLSFSFGLCIDLANTELHLLPGPWSFFQLALVLTWRYTAVRGYATGVRLY